MIRLLKCVLISVLLINTAFAGSSFEIQKYKKDTIISKIRNNGDMVKVIKNLSPAEQERDLCLALNIYFEVRNCVIQEAVASSYTVLNRYYDNDIPGLDNTQTSLCAVVFAPKQYSWTNDDVIPYPKTKKMWKIAQSVAYTILHNERYYKDHAKLFEMKHYMTRTLNDSGYAPKWEQKASFKIQFDGGDHVYMYMKSIPWYKSKTKIAKKLKSMVNSDALEIKSLIDGE
ncbi:MAG: cell wall hydrolase [Alphaproteobacteria bacterium]|nr:cell wall hydrolase [Alphaproteobacteria bacterium]